MSHTIDDLRRRLFATIDGVSAGTLSVEQAREISHAAQVIVNTAKVQVDHMKASGEIGTAPFLAVPSDTDPLPNGITSISRHLLGK